MKNVLFPVIMIMILSVKIIPIWLWFSLLCSPKKYRYTVCHEPVQAHISSFFPRTMSPVCQVWPGSGNQTVLHQVLCTTTHTLPSSSSWTGLHPSLVHRGRQWDQGALLRAVALLPVLLLVLEVQYDPFDPPVIRGGRATLLLHLSCRLLHLLLFLAPLYRRGHYVIKEGEEAIDPIRALFS